MAPRPPYATDEPDAAYDSPAPQRRLRQQPPQNPNDRSSAYDVYDNYLSADANAHNRQSGTDALGRGLLNMDDDDDSDDESSPAPSSNNKHAALAAATSNSSPRSTSPLRVAPKAIAAPQPGYAAPVSALLPPTSPSPPQPAYNPHGPAPAFRNPFDDPTPHIPVPQAISVPRPPPSPTTPHPLQPPITPITPVFARPAKNITFADPTRERTPRPIMRGNNEDPLLPSRGEKGDDFWRRFSMVAKQPESTKESSWLHRTRSRSSQLSRWVWIIGLFLLICIGAAIGIGWYVSHKTPPHQAPTVIGGGEQHGGSATTTAAGGGAVGPNGKPASTGPLKVTPTFTIAKRAESTGVEPIPVPTPAPVVVVPEPNTNAFVWHRRQKRRTIRA